MVTTIILACSGGAWIGQLWQIALLFYANTGIGTTANKPGYEQRRSTAFQPRRNTLKSWTMQQPAGGGWDRC
jgi:hypothetical protein